MTARNILWQVAIGAALTSPVYAQTTPRSATAAQSGAYRQSSSDNGTTVNSSNTTNYNSNNVTNAPTGVGSNPAAPATTSGSSRKRKPVSKGTGTGSATGSAIQKARTAPSPAVTAGSTERNTSIHDFIASSPNYTTLQNALQAVGLFETLRGSKSYTLFAPTNDAFKKLPAAVQTGLLEGRNRQALTQLLNYHLVKGALSDDDLRKKLKSGGTATLKTVAGESLTIASNADGQLTITDQAGNKASIIESDQKQNNGYVHGINAVLMTTGGSAIR
ncbi:fasciclin domain-containing protein [Spirosoma rhododendri]|uniref:Fasciclin domain-containing protein n=1 Tax=Spirosoma rhododendri TaxID=2728024 RepID=A0A7L5DJP9_9BACT|nr:fasciclin domain-containing protein [Spirosoma rhododendri]QJD78674.1 fasciclin domain-containing protein [Spirosoma rhododendri]